MLPANVTNYLAIVHSRAYFWLYAREATLGQRALFMFMEHKVPSASTASPELLLQTFSKYTCHWTIPIDRLDRWRGQLQASIFSAPLIGSVPNTLVKKGGTLGNHMPDVEFVVQSLVRLRSRTVCIRPPWLTCSSHSKQLDHEEIISESLSRRYCISLLAFTSLARETVSKPTELLIS